jgi:two-component system, NtrC family, sensor histidine kinase HydH
MTKKHYHILIIITITCLITYLNIVTAEKFSPHTVLEELYYIPLLLGVLCFGLKGRIATYLFVSAAYSPFLFSPWTTTLTGYMDRVLHLVFTGMFLLITSFLAERERRHRTQAEQNRYLAGIGQVTTIIVHDLKNPLISIQGFARRLQEGKGDPAQAATAIIKAAQTMQKIVNDVLDFAKPIQMDVKVDDIRHVVNRSCNSCKIKAEETGITLEVNLPAKPVLMGVDSFHFERALVNLINNAIEASRKGDQVLIILAIEDDELVIRVLDNGKGMDSETLKNLFTPFYTSKKGGTGLGMPIAKKIINAHSCELQIESQQGVGTEVIIRLPVETWHY